MAYSSEDNISVNDLLKKSSIFLNNDNYDSASFYLDQARNYGLSKDSFFFRYSEIYCQKGVFDTALAFNYAIKVSQSGTLYRSKFEQRYMIYSMLGLKSEAQKAIDSIGNSITPVKKKKSFYLPQITAGLDGNYSTSNILTSDNYYDFANHKMSDYKENELGLNFNCSIKLDLPWPENRFFSIGTGYKNWQSSGQTKISSDSLAHAWNVFAQINNFHSFTFNYTFSREKNLSQFFLSSNSLSISWLKSNNDFSSFGGFSFTGKISLSDSRIYNQLYSLYSFYEWPLTRLFSPFINLIAYYYIIDRSIISQTVNQINITGDLNDPIFLKSNFDTIKKPSPPVTMQNKLDYRNQKIANFEPFLIVTKKLPNSTFTLAPAIDNSFPLFNKIILKTSIGYTFTCYTDYYEWIVVTDYLAYHVDDSLLYRIDEPMDYNGGLDQEPINMIKKRRIDNTISFALSLARPIWKVGDFLIEGSVEKTFSNMSDYAPADIPDWSWTISSSLTVNYPFRK